MAAREELLRQVEEYAALLFTRTEILLIAQLPRTEMHSEDFNQAYRRGRLLQMARYRATLNKMAEAGSQPALNAALKLAELTALMDDDDDA